MELKTLILLIALHESRKFVIAESVNNSEVSDINIKDVRFFLYTQNNKIHPTEIWLNNTQSILKSEFDFKTSTKFITHGLQSSYLAEITILIRNAFLDHYNFNVIAVDWSEISELPVEKIIPKTKKIASYIAKMVDLLENLGYNPKNISLVGHSAGALIVGLTGRQTTNKVGHLVALDPPNTSEIELKINKSISEEQYLLFHVCENDAHFVEIIYTAFAVQEQFGHVSYYPNGGISVQPGCLKNASYLDPELCSHLIAYKFYSEAIKRPERFLAIKCSDYQTFLAGNCNNNTVTFFPNSSTKEKENGLYYLRTDPNKPFGLGINGIKPYS